MISVRRVPPGWVVVARDDEEIRHYERLGVPIYNCGLAFYVPSWARRLVAEWPLERGTARVIPRYEHELRRAIRAIWLERVKADTADEAAAAVLAALDLGGPGAVAELIDG